MRIIAGSAGGARIDAPKGTDTRPTLDKVRESLFNILAFRIADKRVLDLFAGSGAMGLEAVSRGAKSAVLCDIGREPIRVIQRNVEKLRFEASVTVERGDWRDCLIRLSGRGERFDIAFLDPPYSMTDTGAIAKRLKELSLLNEGALIVIEHDKDFPPDIPKDFTMTDQRRYRETSVTFLTLGG